MTRIRALSLMSALSMSACPAPVKKDLPAPAEPQVLSMLVEQVNPGAPAKPMGAVGQMSNGERYQITVNAEKVKVPLFLYTRRASGDGKRADEASGKVEAGKQTVLPEGTYFKLEGDAGRDRIYLVGSVKELGKRALEQAIDGEEAWYAQMKGRCPGLLYEPMCREEPTKTRGDRSGGDPNQLRIGEPEEPTKTRGPCDEIKACLDDKGLVILRLGFWHK